MKRIFAESEMRFKRAVEAKRLRPQKNKKKNKRKAKNHHLSGIKKQKKHTFQPLLHQTPGPVVHFKHGRGKRQALKDFDVQFDDLSPSRVMGGQKKKKGKKGKKKASEDDMMTDTDEEPTTELMTTTEAMDSMEPDDNDDVKSGDDAELDPEESMETKIGLMPNPWWDPNDGITPENMQNLIDSMNKMNDLFRKY